MALLTVELDEATAARLRERAAREGIEVSVLASRLLSAVNECDPFGFVGSFESDDVAADHDRFLRSEGFGAT